MRSLFIKIVVGRKYAWAAMAVFLPALSFGQSECRDILKKVYANYEQRYMEGKGNTLFFDLLIKAEGKDGQGKLRSQSSNMQLVMSENFYSMQNEHMKVYADKKDVFTLLPSSKIIYHGNASSNFKTDSLPLPQFKEWEKIVKSCECTKKKGVGYDLELNMQMNIVDGLNRITSTIFRIDSERLQFHSVITQFLPTATLKRMEVVYLKTDFTYNNPMKKKVTSYFIDSRTGKLLPSYKGYQLLEAKK